VSGLSAPDFLTHDFVEGSYEVASQELRAKNPFAPLQRNKKIGRRHEADFCSDIDFSSMMLSSSLLVLLSRPETRRLLSRLSRTGTASLRNWTAISRKSHESDTQRHPRWIFYAAIHWACSERNGDSHLPRNLRKAFSHLFPMKGTSHSFWIKQELVRVAHPAACRECPDVSET